MHLVLAFWFQGLAEDTVIILLALKHNNRPIVNQTCKHLKHPKHKQSFRVTSFVFYFYVNATTSPPFYAQKPDPKIPKQTFMQQFKGT